jgi:hypothetical protein
MTSKLILSFINKNSTYGREQHELYEYARKD